MPVDSSEVRPLSAGPAGDLPEILHPTVGALVRTLVDFLGRELPHRRVARLAGLLHLAGAQIGSALTNMACGYLRSRQRADGGWVDCEDTAWCAYVLDNLAADERSRLPQTVRWLTDERAGPAWGYCRRDDPCIPITATVRMLVPVLRDDRSAQWLRKTWSDDLSKPIRLSYKGAWYLLAHGDRSSDTELIDRTVKHLVSDQRADGGWGPWRDHPAPTDCFSTGLAMWALGTRTGGAQIEKALAAATQWCYRTRLESGLFPTHFIEEGSAWLLLGWAAALHRVAQSRG